MVKTLRSLVSLILLFYTKGTKEIWTGKSYWYGLVVAIIVPSYFTEHTIAGLMVIFLILPIIAFFSSHRISINS